MNSSPPGSGDSVGAVGNGTKVVVGDGVGAGGTGVITMDGGASGGGAGISLGTSREHAATTMSVPRIATRSEWWNRIASVDARRVVHVMDGPRARRPPCRRLSPCPSIDTLVDIGNLVSIRHALPVVILDLASIRDGLTVRFTDGDEQFTDLGSGTTEALEPGEVIFIDAIGHVAARRWCWRQSGESASSASTTDMLVTVEGHHDGAREEVMPATADIDALLRAHASPTVVWAGLVDADAPTFGGAD